DDALKQSDRSVLKRAAHTLKGSSRNFGAFAFSELCKTLETSAPDADLAELAEQVKILKESAASVRAAMSEELALLKREAERERADVAGTGKIAGAAPEDGVATVSRVMVVDDDRGMRLTMRKILETDGYAVQECENGREALRLCEREMPDLVLMDALMPGMDGFTACRALRDMEGGQHVPILIVTALEDETSIDRAFSAGANDFIPKPVNFAVLRQRIARLL